MVNPTFHDGLAAFIAVVIVAVVSGLAIFSQPVPDFLLAAFTLVIGYVFGRGQGKAERLNGELTERMIRLLHEWGNVQKP